MTNKEKAYTYFDRIGTGHRNAVHRPLTGGVDREFRALIEYANNNGDCIISGDAGYYRPVPGDPVDSVEYHRYMKQEKSRAESISTKAACMQVAYELRGFQNEE